MAFCFRSGSTKISRFDAGSYGRDKKTLMVACTNYTIEEEDQYMRYPSGTVLKESSNLSCNHSTIESVSI